MSASPAREASSQSKMGIHATRRRRIAIPTNAIVMWLARIAAVVVAGAVWDLVSRQKIIDPLFIGSPIGVLKALYRGLFETHDLASALYSTMQGTVIGFVLGAAVALLIGLAFVIWPLFERFSDPFFAAINAVPRIALAPLVILWFGLGLESKIVLGASLAFFVVLSSVVAGAHGVESDFVTLMRMLGAPRRETFLRVVVPSAIPEIFGGLRLGLIYSLLGVVSGEIIASSSGLGQLLNYNAGLFRTDSVFAILVLLAIVGGVLTSIMNAIERGLIRWK